MGLFDLIDDIIEVPGIALNSVSKTVEEFADDPIGKSVDVALQPVNDGLEVLGGLTEGEFRTAAAMRLGVDVVAGMALSELIELCEK